MGSLTAAGRGRPGSFHSRAAASADRDGKPLSRQPRPCPQPSLICYTSSFLMGKSKEGSMYQVPSGTSPLFPTPDSGQGEWSTILHSCALCLPSRADRVVSTTSNSLGCSGVEWTGQGRAYLLRSSSQGRGWGGRRHKPLSLKSKVLRVISSE